jgi:hypothetical protein
VVNCVGLFLQLLVSDLVCNGAKHERGNRKAEQVEAYLWRVYLSKEQYPLGVRQDDAIVAQLEGLRDIVVDTDAYVLPEYCLYARRTTPWRFCMNISDSFRYFSYISSFTWYRLFIVLLQKLVTKAADTIRPAPHVCDRISCNVIFTFDTLIHWCLWPWCYNRHVIDLSSTS